MHKIIDIKKDVLLKALTRFLFSFHNTPYTKEGKTPSKLLFNRKENPIQNL